MLDVHVPHPTHTWKDFFIHIATIVVGLLIAVGLEQTIEYFHHRHQGHEMEEALRDESLENRSVIQNDLVSAADDRRVIRLNMDALDRIRLAGSKQPFTPVPFTHDAFYAPTDTAWLTLRGNGLLSLVPHQLADSYWKVDFMAQAVIDLMKTIDDSRRKINALLSLHTDPTLVKPEERAALLQAYSDMDQSLRDMHYALTYFNLGNEMALAGKSLTLEESAKEYDKAN